jgi:hypothetical protein
MWCVGALTEEYRSRMYSLLKLYAKPRQSDEPVVCIDEKSQQLIGHSRAALPMKPGSPTKQDYEYVRKGTVNLFVAVEPKAGQRVVCVTERRCKTDFVAFVQTLLSETYATARRVHIVLDNLNTHLSQILRRRAGSACCWQAAAPGALSRHAQTCALAEHGRDRDWHPEPPMLGPAHCQPA